MNNTKNIVRQYAYSAIITMLTVLTILMSSSCCIDLTNFLETKEVHMTIGDNPEVIDQTETNDLSGQSGNRNIDYSAIKKELADASDYQKSEEEEEDFFLNLEKIYPEDKYICVKDYLNKFKVLYPSGYFTLVKVTQKQDYNSGYAWFERFENFKNKLSLTQDLEKDLENYPEQTDFYSDYSQDISTIVHELTHLGSGHFLSIFFEDLNYH